MTTSPPMLALSGVSKQFPGTRALDNVGIDIAPGQLHALLGANGSGKSTLIKIITGAEHPEAGATAAVHGATAPLTVGAVGGTLHGLRVRCVHQDLGLVDSMSVLDNMALIDGHPRNRVGLVDWTSARRRARQLLSEIGLEHIDLDDKIEHFDQLTKIQIAIARVIGTDTAPGLVILDEPTANLPGAEVEHVFTLVRELLRRGNSVLYVTHRLAEVFELSTDITVLRAGRVVHTGPTAELDRGSLVAHMLGHAAPPSADTTSTATPPSPGGASIAVRDLRSNVLRGVSFTVGPGQILGLAGVAGAGHDEVPWALIGDAGASGTLTLGDAEVEVTSLDPARARALGVAFVPPDRRRDGILPTLSIRANLALSTLASLTGRLGLVNRHAEASFADDWVRDLDIVPAAPDRQVGLLSGGNQQKVVVGRCLSTSPQLLLLSEPTAGVDVGARAQLWEMVRKVASSGVSVIVSSTDLDDLAALCDRILVLRNGEIHTELGRSGERAIAEAVLASHA